MATQPATFNPEAVRFIASRYGLKQPEQLAPILGFPEQKLKAWSKGTEIPNNDEAILLLAKTGLPLEWFTTEREPQALAA